MLEINYALYHAFSETAAGGSAAAIITDTEGLDSAQMQQIAISIGAPASCFVTGLNGNSIDVRFFSTRTEYSMCGHGTIALVSCLAENNQLPWSAQQQAQLILNTPASSAEVFMQRRADNRPEVMLSLASAEFEPGGVAAGELARLFALDEENFSSDTPIEITHSDFSHLIVPVDSLQSMQKIRPDYDAIIELCVARRIDTIAMICGETVLVESDVHCREFCPAVGTPESAATGTTNRAIALYLLRHAQIIGPTNGALRVISEQGYEMQRPSRIVSDLIIVDDRVVGIKTGGVASLGGNGSVRV